MTQDGITGAQRHWLKAGLVVATLWSGALLFRLWQESDGVAEVITFIALIIDILLPFFIVRQVRVSPINRRLARRIVLAVVLLDFLFTAGWAAKSFDDRNRSIDITAKVFLRNNFGVAHGGRVESDMEIGAVRRAIVVVLNVTDRYPEQGSCVPFTTMKVTVTSGSYSSPAETATAGQPTTLAYPPSTGHLRLEIVVINERDHNCAVDITVASAKLINR